MAGDTAAYLENEPQSSLYGAGVLISHIICQRQKLPTFTSEFLTGGATKRKSHITAFINIQDFCNTEHFHQ